MKWVFLMLQGGLMGAVAGWAFPGWGWEFFAILIVNGAFVVSYGDARAMEMG